MNPRHEDFQSSALPTELPDHFEASTLIKFMFEKSMINYALAAIISLAATNGAFAAGWEYYYHKGTIQFEGGLNRSATENLERSLEIKPDQAEIHVSAGDIRDFFGYREKAFEHYQSAVRADPSNVEAHFRLVRYYAERRDTANADRHFAAAYAIGGRDAERILSEALEEERRNNAAGALALYKRALGKNPAFLEAYFRLAELHRRLGRSDEAISALEEVKRIRPDNEKAHVYLGHLYYAARYGSRRKYLITQAIRNFERALEINPSNPETLFGLSEAYRLMGDRDRADELRERALSLEGERKPEAGIGPR